MNDKIQSIYKIILDQVEQVRVINETDKILMKRLAFNIYTVEECEQQLLSQGFVTQALHGNKEHPAVAVKNKAEAKMREAYVLLGIDFSSTFKKQLAGSNEDSWSDFL